MNDFLGVSQALSDPSRLRIVHCLRGGERCVCQIVELLGLAPSTVSKHLFLLRHAGLIEARRAGRWMHYRLAGATAPPVVRGAIEWAIDATRTEAQVLQDEACLQKILSMNPEALCLKQRASALIDEPTEATAGPAQACCSSDALNPDAELKVPLPEIAR